MRAAAAAAGRIDRDGAGTAVETDTDTDQERRAFAPVNGMVSGGKASDQDAPGGGSAAGGMSGAESSDRGAPPASAGAACAATHAAGVTIAGVYKGFGDHSVLRGVDLVVPEGSITAILGPSGSGKTTLLRALAGFARPDGGVIEIGGRVVDGPGRHLAPDLRRVGYVPQEGSLFPHLDVTANIGFGLPRSRRRERVAQLLELTGLTELRKRYPHQLSGGQQQRVALARALAPRPALVLLDEPFSSLDASLRASVRRDVVRILREAGTTTVLVTHDQDEALSTADLVAVIRDGRIAQCAPPREVYGRPADAGVARFVGDANLVEGTVAAGAVKTLFGLLPLAGSVGDAGGGGDRELAGSCVRVLVRPEQVELRASPADAAAESPNAEKASHGEIPGIVADCDYHGHDATVRIEVVGTDAAASEGAAHGSVVARLAGDLVPAPGTPVLMRVRGPVVVWTGGLGDGAAAQAS